MAEVQKTENGKRKVPEFLREPLVAAQARFGQIEEEADILAFLVKNLGMSWKPAGQRTGTAG